MIPKSDAYLAGYRCATQEPPAILTAIVPPETYSDAERSDYVSGFLVGARHRLDNELMDELEASL